MEPARLRFAWWSYIAWLVLMVAFVYRYWLAEGKLQVVACLVVGSVAGTVWFVHAMMVTGQHRAETEHEKRKEARRRRNQSPPASNT